MSIEHTRYTLAGTPSESHSTSQRPNREVEMPPFPYHFTDTFESFESYAQNIHQNINYNAEPRGWNLVNFSLY